MKYIKPDYYDQFRCIAGACRHTCCRDWDIDIDDESLTRYRGVGGDMGRRLSDSIYEDEDGAHFRCGADGRCPFLNDEGLCDVITGLGEDMLCHICAHHPRYYSYYADRVEAGLGLSCEAAARLILTREQPMRLVEEEWDRLPPDMCADDVDPELSGRTLELRGRLMAIAQDRSLPVSARVERMLEAAGTRLPVWDGAACADVLMELECLHGEWQDALARLRTAEPGDCPPEWELPLEQLLCSLIYRHMALMMEGEPLESVTRLIAFCWRLVRDLCAAGGDRSVEALIETARMFSEEIEYSDENVYAIMDALEE